MGGRGYSDEEEDKALDEIFDSLILDDDHWSVSEDGADDSKRVEDLLARLKEGHEAQAPSPGRTPNDIEERGHDDDDDDSEGEEMSRQVENVLSRTKDELKLQGYSEPTEPGEAHEPTGSNTANTSDADTGPTEKKPEDTQATTDTELALPAVPQTPTREEPPLPDLPTTPRDKDDGDALTLPAVPSILQDPVPASKASDPFEASIEARLAALKGPGHNPVRTDDFGLPSAPTFQPEDRPVAGIARRPRPGGFTDDDQKTWCIVCLEDATVRCMGCDGDVYCARCWREMHVGPQAGYDERGHRWEKFDPRER